MNEYLMIAVSFHLSDSLVPAAAVIPALVSYFDVVAVKMLVVCWYPGLHWARVGLHSLRRMLLLASCRSRGAAPQTSPSNMLSGTCH
jgi:hypothetical protein